MKQMKFFLVALMAVVMGMSVTSCMNGDDNTQVNDLPVLGKVKDSFLGLTFTSLDGFTFKSKNTVEGTTNFMPGDFIVATCSYDTEVDIDYTTNTINATIGSTEKISGNAVYSTTKAEDEGEHPSYVSDRGVISITDLTPAMIDNYNLLVPIQYFAFEKIASHTFFMVYYSDENELKGKTDLKLFLRHTSTEEKAKETYRAFSYRVFDIRSAIEAYKNANEGRYPSKISSPAKAWEEISMEEDRRKVFMAFVYPMIGLCGLSVFIGSLLTNGWGGPQSFQIAMTNCCAVAVALFGGYFLAAYAINEMGTKMFGMHANMPLVQQFAGYALVVPFLLQIVTGLLPDFRIIAWLLQFYIVYVVWEGAPIMMKVEEKQRLKYTLLSSVLLILCPTVIQFVFNKLTAILN